MNRFIKNLTFVTTLYSSIAFAQVSGVVTDESGFPLPGVSVLIKGTQNGTQSNIDGKFEIDAKDGQVLVFSFIGMESKELPATTAPMQITLDDSTRTLDEVVVTALGIKREKKALGYSQQQISGEELNSSGQTNVLTGLSGNIAGVQVTAPSSMGGSNRITIRGINSITGNNKPLIVVDGIPFDNSNFNSSDTQRGAGGRDYGDTSADINPEDIESVTVLKGGAAAALYGSRAQNGVIMYTTKSAKKGKSEVSFKTGVDLETVYIMPKLQREYGGGYGLDQQVINGQTYNLAQYSVDESWGPKYDPNLMYLAWDAFDPNFPDQYMKERAWVAPKNDVKSFFNTGVTTTNSAALSHATDKSNIRLSYTNQLTNGIVPNSNLSKNMLSLNGGAKITEKLKFDAMISYTDTKGFNRPEQGYGDNSLAQKFYQWGQRQLDYGALKSYINPDGSQRTWNRTAWDDATPAYSDNPYWVINKNTSSDRRHRVYGNVKLQYDFNENFFAVANLYGDHYDFKIGNRVAVGSQAMSSYDETKYLRSEFNYELRLHFNKNFGDFSVNAFAGVNKRRNTGSSLRGFTSGGLIIPDFYNLSNSVNPSRSEKSETVQTINSMYGMASFGYKGYLFLEGTVRKDYFSTVNKAGVYPSISGSFIFSQLMTDQDWLSFGKVRASWAQVSNGADPYSLLNYYNIGTPFQGIPTYGQSATANYPDLKPETKTSKELGLEMKFFNNRFGFDVAYYQDRTKDLITPLQITGATGFQYKYFNIGEMENKGLEATVFVNPVRTENFNWDITWNFSKNNNKLLSLEGQAETYTIASAPFRASLVAQVGQPYGQIFGTDYTYDDNGNRIVENGLYKPTSTVKALGSVIPDYNMGIRNTFTYKNITLSALVDIQKGGHYFSTSHMWGMYSGMLEGSAANGIRENGIILPGVTADGQPNTVVTSGYDYSQNHYNNVDAQNVFDASYIKLREVTLGYSFPAKYFNNKISALRISAYARNLFAWGLDWKGMDPENTSYGSGNIQGLEGGSLPSVRSFGANLEIKL
ncbi:SusC/RagA family TonB-linked outer membrane protein [Flavobacterium agricola]|uniref:SusC/RagA family TonB-linked outer membrane protein n=1 Tax=Flavobacterium agricola TaxID=2870839 RepID=A0ABY6M148_9FLAO|nr:SusC/RagA family TonB-linked outer membrane protein [Flavobacterium agricola]UYW01389.1 SusC/RagA family TonB-linked outer membrane protein [Flavobacterium agricola]